MREFLFYVLILIVAVPFLYMTIEVFLDIFRRLAGGAFGFEKVRIKNEN